LGRPILAGQAVKPKQAPEGPTPAATWSGLLLALFPVVFVEV
jgi:hypothetical protein